MNRCPIGNKIIEDTILSTFPILSKACVKSFLYTFSKEYRVEKKW